MPNGVVTATNVETITVSDETAALSVITVAGTGPQGSSGSTVPDATVASKGVIQLAGDLAGTAASPTVPGLASKATDSAVLHKAGSETVTGSKTFNAGMFLDKGSQVFNVKAYGAVGDGSTDDTAAVTNAVTALNAASGGILLFPQGGNYVLTPPIQIASNTHVINQGTITLNTSYTISGTTFRGIFRLGSTSGTDIVDNVEIEGGLVVGDCFSATAWPSPTFNVNNHKYVCYVHSVATHRNVRVHDVKTNNMGSPVTFEKVGGNNGTPTRNTHVYNVQEENSWVGIQFYCNGWAYEDCSVHDIDVKYCYDDCVAIVAATGGIGGATGIARRINVYNIRGEKSGQTGAGVKLDATGGSLSDINVYGINLSTAGVNEYPTSIIGATAANNKKFNFWGIQCSGTWNYGFYAQTNGRQIRYTNFFIEALHGIHFQGNSVPGAAQSIQVLNGTVLSRNASSADTIEGNGISYSAGTGTQGFQNVIVEGVSFRNKAVPVNEGASVPSGTGVQGTYQNFRYSIDVRNSATTDCVFSSSSSTVRFYKEGLYISDSTPGNDKTYTQAFSSVSTVNVTHNLGKNPSVTVVDSAGDICDGYVHYTDSNNLTVTFSASFSGTVYCN